MSGIDRFPGLTLALVAVCSLLTVAEGWAEWLAYDRTAIARGEIWRFWTAHLTHDSYIHLLSDGAALLLLGTLLEYWTARRAFVAILLVGASAVLMAAWFVVPEMGSYRGSSSLTYLMGAVVGYEAFRRRWRVIVWPIGMLVTGKWLYEAFNVTGHELVRVAWEVHGLAVLMGLALAWVFGHFRLFGDGLFKRQN